ncbi:MAG: hypothetical protein HY319_06790 [Armatimonadetes bacterium]|nr:hypothetical protein [Armatimonadota bacterium]
MVLDSEPRLLTLDRDWLRSSEGDVLAGNYGAITTVELELEPGECDSCAVLLVPTGGWAGAVWEGRLRSLHAFAGLVIFKAKAPARLRWEHTLTANSYAPTHLLVVPYRAGGGLKGRE